MLGFVAAAALCSLMLTQAATTGVSGIADGSLRAAVSPSCKIKGNVSINTGERIYHVPGQEFYSITEISSRYGERWFCSEAEAQQAGWRRARS